MIQASANAARATPAADRPAPLITVAICTRNRAALLRKAVDSVLGQLPSDADILIIDNASTDDTPAVGAALAAANPAVTIICETQLGLSSARNAALRSARGKYVLFLDDDAVAEPRWLETYRTFLINPPSPRIAVVGSGVLPNFEAPPPKWLASGAHQLNLGTETRRVHATGGPWGGNAAYDRLTTLAAGGFDTDLGRKGKSMGSHEEVELMARLEDAGFEIWWLSGANILHLTPASRLSFGWQCRAAFADGRSKAILRLRRTGGGARRLGMILGRVLIAPFHFLINFLVVLVLLPFRHGQPATESLHRALRIAGFAWESLAQIGGGR